MHHYQINALFWTSQKKPNQMYLLQRSRGGCYKMQDYFPLTLLEDTVMRLCVGGSTSHHIKEAMIRTASLYLQTFSGRLWTCNKGMFE